MNYTNGNCFFVSSGFLSILNPSSRTRTDLPITSSGREISSIATSRNGNKIAVGELGMNSKVYIIGFNSEFDEIIEKTEIKTKENGFSCMFLDYENGRLVTIGNDDHPFCLLWDIEQAKPQVIGYYHLNAVPNHVSLSVDCKMITISGDQFLICLDSSFLKEPSPISMRSKKINISQFKDSNFIASFTCPKAPIRLYSLTTAGVLCIFDPATIEFGSRKDGINSEISLSSLPLNCGTTTSLALDDKIILVGNQAGTILALKREKNDHIVFGQFSADGKPVTTIGIAQKVITGTYSNGSIVYFARKLGAKPSFSIFGHRGPVCAMSISNDHSIVLSGGSDGTVRSWRIQNENSLLGKKSQEQVASQIICRPPLDYVSIITGVRCICVKNGFAFCGDYLGSLHMLKIDKLLEVQKYTDLISGIYSIASENNTILTGGGDGKIRIYGLVGNALSRPNFLSIHQSPITSLLLVDSIIVSCSSESLCFTNIKTLSVINRYDIDVPILSLSLLPNHNFVISAGFDGCVKIWNISTCKVFRKYFLSHSSYPTSVAIDDSGILIAASMSDGSILILDIMSGDVLSAISFNGGVGSSILFHDDALLLSTTSGCIMRWILPSSLVNAIGEKKNETLPIFDLIQEPHNEPNAKSPLKNKGSFIPSSDIIPDWVFHEIKIPPLPIVEGIMGDDSSDTDEENENINFDAPRPSINGYRENEVDKLVRASISKNKQDSDDLIIFDSPNRTPNSTNSPLNDKHSGIIPQSDSHLPIKPLEEDILDIPHESIHDCIHSDPEQNKEAQNRSSEINQISEELKRLFLQAKEFINQTPSGLDEECAMSSLKEVLNTIHKDSLQSEWFKNMIVTKVSEMFHC